jgi:glycosyltransferase involved in cell wall biosynthesis
MDRSLTVVIPVHNAAGLLDACLSSVSAQLGPDDQVVVADDASDDNTVLIAEAHGATVLRLPEQRGPYVARQQAADATESWGLVFIDARCRAQPGWLDSHRDLLARTGVALSCSGVLTVAGRSLASRVAAYLQPFRPDATLVGHRLPYFPTCNLGVLRAAFDQVGGFGEMRSGGDADLCWRIQDDGLGEFAVDPEVLVEWVPRQSVRDLAAQMARYGTAAARLNSSTSNAKPTPVPWGEHARAVRDDLRSRRAAPHVIAVAYAVLAGQRFAQAWERARLSLRRAR